MELNVINWFGFVIYNRNRKREPRRAQVSWLGFESKQSGSKWRIQGDECYDF